ncbi:TIM-barrel domain-containing protein [Paenibacillus mesophilus]|uniref:TIM-barrel domain-containing protein n=1 Tax=Paenibacillus mesophilus TaxID=2582849 RepID=UPI0013053AF7|nr:TIM-barrel domain-containing protein [Paenibacillus mesophilus]
MSSPFLFRLPDGPFVCIQVVSARTFRFRMSECSDFPEPPLVRYGFLTVEGAAEPEFAVMDTSSQVTVMTQYAVISVDKRDGTIALSRTDGSVLTSSAIPPRSGRVGGFEAQFRLAEDEKLYGLGDIAKDRLQLRGLCAEIRMAMDNSRVPIPFLMSSKGWALLINTTRIHTIDIGCTVSDRLSFRAADGELDCFLIAGDNYGELLDGYTDLTGKPSLLPIWAYGLTYLSNQYATARDIIEDGMNFRREGIPCDTIGLEPGWMETYRDHSTEKKWHPERFAIPAWNPKGPRTFMGALERMGFKLSMWLCCQYDITQEEERLLAAESGDEPDGERQEAWYDHLKKFVDQGVSAFKLEGYVFDHIPGLEWANKMSSADMHHLYQLLLCKQMHLGYSNQTGRRPLLFSMSGYAGIQKYAATWADYHHKNAIALLNQNMSGNVYALTDMDVQSPSGIHLGFLQTLSQVNSWAYWHHPNLLEPELLQMFRMYAKLRYRLLPYLYSAVHTAARSGMPVIRPMPLVYPDDPMSDGLLMQYMLGDALLVALERHVYLPEGEWYDFWSGEWFAGPLELDYEIPPHAGGPLFVRGGAIIPEWPEISHVGPDLPELIRVRFYPSGESGEYRLYEDDGITYGYKEREFAETNMGFLAGNGRISISIAPRTGVFNGLPTKRLYEVRIHMRAVPLELLVNGAPFPFNQPGSDEKAVVEGWQFDAVTREVRLRVSENPIEQQSINIEVLCDIAGRNGSAQRRNTNPEASLAMEQPSSTNEIIRQVLAQLDHDAGLRQSLNDIADKLHINSSHLSRLFKREVGFPFSEFVLKLRMERAKQMLLENFKTADIADTLGFTDSSHFIRIFRKYWGTTPGKLKSAEQYGNLHH